MSNELEVILKLTEIIKEQEQIIKELEKRREKKEEIERIKSANLNALLTLFLFMLPITTTIKWVEISEQNEVNKWSIENIIKSLFTLNWYFLGFLSLSILMLILFLWGKNKLKKLKTK